MLPEFDVLQTIDESRASVRALLLDCSVEGTSTIPAFGRQLTHLLSSAPAQTAAGERTSTFTGELVACLYRGIVDGPELLTLDDIARQVIHTFIARRVPLPQFATRITSGNLALFRNLASVPTDQTSFSVEADPESLPQPSPTEHVPWQHDAPATRDLLNRAALAEVLAIRLRQARAESPQTSFLIHVDGQWGAGKSTLLNLLAADLDRDSLVVHFNAWRHSRVQPSWWPLLTAVREQVVKSRAWPLRPFLRLRETAMRIRKAGAGFILSMLATLAVVVVVLTAFLNGTDPTKAGGLTTLITSGLAAAGVVWAATRVGTRLFLWDSARGARLFEQSHTDPMGDVAHHFSWLLKRSRKPVVIFVDDLDRCEQSVVVETLEVIQNLIRDSPADPDPHPAAGFVVSADGAWLRAAFEGRFEAFKSAIDEPGRPLGYLFQDKLFQLSVPLRFLSAESQTTYVGWLLKSEAERPKAIREGRTLRIEADNATLEIEGAVSEAEVVRILRTLSEPVRDTVAAQAAVKMAQPDIQKSTEHVLLKFSPLLDSNPRGIKRFLNTYAILRTLRTLEGVPVDADTLAGWAIIRSRWPHLADALERRPELIDATDPGDESLPEAVRTLAASAEFARCRDRLPAPLAESDVRACCGNRTRHPAPSSPPPAPAEPGGTTAPNEPPATPPYETNTTPPTTPPPAT